MATQVSVPLPSKPEGTNRDSEGERPKDTVPVDIIILLLHSLALYLIGWRLCAWGASVPDCPVVRHALKVLVIIHHHLGDLSVLWVLRVGSL